MKTNTYLPAFFARILGILIITLLSVPIFAQATFENLYGSGRSISVTKTSTGYQLIIKRTSNYEVIQTDENGNQQSTVDLGSFALKIVPLPDGGFAKIDNYYSPTEFGLRITKHTATGAVSWTKDVELYNTEVFEDMVPANDGNVLVLFSDDNSSNPSIYISHVSPTQLTYSTNLQSAPISSSTYVFKPTLSRIVQKPNSEIIVASSGRTAEPENGAIQIIKVNASLSSASRELIAETSGFQYGYGLLDLVAAPNNKYITVYERYDVGSFDTYISYVQEDFWTLGEHTTPLSALTSVQANYFSIFPTLTGGIVAATEVSYYEPLNGNPLTNSSYRRHSTMSRHEVIMAPDWIRDLPEHSYSGMELPDTRLVFSGEKEGMAFLMVTNADARMDCTTPSGFSKLGDFGGSEYYISNSPMTWEAAQMDAQMHGGYMASIGSEAENTMLYNNLSEIAFIGLTDKDSEGFLAWDNGDPLSYNHINTSCGFCGSNTDSKDYATMMPWNGEWGFDGGLTTRKYILEKECTTVSGMTIDVECPSEFYNFYNTPPIEYPVVITNNTDTNQPQQTLNLFQIINETIAGTPNKVYSLISSVTVPALLSRESVSLTLTTLHYAGGYTAFKFLPNNSLRIGDNTYRFGNFFFSFDDSGETNQKPVDFYCKKYSTDLEVTITEAEYSNTADGMMLFYRVDVYNNGSEDAYNVVSDLATIQNYPFNSVTLNPGDPMEDYAFTDPSQQNNNTATAKTYYPHIAPGENVHTIVKYFFGDDGPNTITIDANAYSGHLINDPNPANNTTSHTFTKSGGSGCLTDYPDFAFLGTYNNHNYFLSNNQFRWNDALNASMYFPDSYLAAIGDQAENDFIQSKLGNNMAFIGLSDVASEGNPVWSNGEPFVFDNSNTNANNHDFAVMNFWNGEWDFYNFWTQKKFIMEMDCTAGAAPQQQSIAVNLPELQELNPNPASDYVEVRMFANEESTSTISIFDARGQVLLTEKKALPQGASVHSFDISQFPVGVYFVKIAGSSDYMRFIKQ